MRNVLLLYALTATLLFSQTPTAQSLIADGDAALRQMKWHDAELAYQKATEADPQSAEAHAKLSNVLALQLRRGLVTSDENRPLITRILAEQQKAADLAPQDAQNLFHLARIQDAISRASQDPVEQSQLLKLSIENMRRVLALQPNNRNFHFALATTEIFALERAFGKAARGTEGQPGSLRLSDDALRQKMASQYAPTADDAVAQMQQVSDFPIGVPYNKHMAAVAYRLRAALADSEADAAHDGQLADKSEQEFEAQITHLILTPQLPLAVNPGDTGVIGGVIAGVPPPPPPPLPRLPLTGPQRIGGNVMEANLLKKVEAVYPPLAKSARVQGRVEFTATIDTTGHIVSLELVRGHPLLVNAAKEAILQWEYRPTLLNGKPVSVITDVIINFTLTQ
jgi:TonB family protein